MRRLRHRSLNEDTSEAASAPGRPATQGARVDRITIVAGSAAIVALSILSHHAARAIAGAALGGELQRLTSTAVEGDWSRLSEAELVVFGASGTLTNAALAFMGWSRVRSDVGRPRLGAVMGWLTFALNAWMAVGYLILSPALGFGDWMEILEAFPNRGPARVSMVVTGLFVGGLLWKATVETLARVVGNGAPSARVARAAAITRTAWLVAGSVSGMTALLAPADVATTVLFALGTTLGTTWPMVLSARHIDALPVPGLPLSLPRSWRVVAFAVIVVSAFVLGLGPGLDPTV